MKITAEEFQALRTKALMRRGGLAALCGDLEAQAKPQPLRVAKARTTVNRPSADKILTDKPWTYGPVTMPGKLCSKSNSRQIVRMGNRTAVIKSAEARRYIEDFLRLMPVPEGGPYTGPVALYVEAFYSSRRPDLDVALLQDALQGGTGKRRKPFIIENDRQIYEIHARRYIDPARPRVVFKLVALEGSRENF